MFVPTALSPAEQAKVPTPGYVPLMWDELELAMSAPSGQRPRTFGYLEPAEGETYGQIVKLTSQHYVDQYKGRLSFAWLSDTTIADLVRPA